MEKRESELKITFMRHFRARLPTFVGIRHEDTRTGGTPDLSVTGNKLTSWWEFKHGTPEFTSKGNQIDQCLRLAAAGLCWYVIWMEKGLDKQTIITHPWQVRKHLVEGQPLIAEAVCIGFSHLWLIERMKQIHGIH